MARTWNAARRIALSGASLAAILLAAGNGLAQTSDAAPKAAAADDTVLEELVVTGSSIRGVPPVGSNLISVTREDIQAIGAVSTPDLLATVPQLNSFNTAPQASLGGMGSYAPGMRGLPASATLPLMNGHRLVAAAANETNPDYPLIPGLAIERVEIVADGASSIYGSDAVAGVVNFITRKRFSGVELNASYGAADDYVAGYVGALVGKDWGSGSILAAYQYAENGNVTGGDRDYRVQDFRPQGGIDTRATSCPSPNVLASTTLWSIYQAAPAFGLNTVNYCDSGAVADLLPKSRTHSLFVSGRQDLSDRATLWGELLYSDRHDEIRAAAPAQTVFITSANPFFQGPAGATSEYVLFRPDNLIGSDHFTNTDDRRAGNSSVGVDYKLPRDLNLTVYGSYDWAENDAFIPQINTAAITAAAAGTTTATALDPFGTGTSPTVRAAILNSSTDVDIKQTTKLAAAKLDGPLMDLPGGTLRFAVGAEVRRETFQQRGVVGATAVPEDLKRDVKSIYGELFVPIIGAGNSAPLFRSLSLSLSGRYDDYSDFGSTTNPKVGVNWEPVEGVTLRGSYGTSFRAPGLRQVGATVGSYYLSAAQAVTFANDPTRGAIQVNTVYLLGGNRDLKPEEAKTYSFGVDVNPKTLPALRASLTYYNIEYTGVIGTPSVPYVFTDPTFAGQVYRNPTPTQLNALLALATPVNLPSPLPAIGNVLDLRLNNFGVRKTDGLDFDTNYRWTTSFGSVFADLAGNYILNFDTQFSPGAPVSDSLKLGVPRWTARATLGAVAGPVSVIGYVNHRDGITNNFTTPTGVGSYEADGYTTVDLRVIWTLPDKDWTKGTVLALQVNDLFDETPPFFPATDGIGGAYNPIGRFVAVNLRKSF
ncbi:TonB-dependent receptor [Caulobacter sp. CCG-8]|uniref:TonB-dependent receptor plug domain-containing protein n=1 Tax=Caulobacter sp. CCG-8 TaxID=3127958 RepID=UPI00307CF5AC